MKIIDLRAENIKRLKAVEITPTDNTVIISGQNGQGKSSVLDAIVWALQGKSAIQGKPIRDGETKAFIRLDLGDFIVERKFTEAGSYLHVSNENGAQFKSPQAMLDGLIGAISFDPLEFSRMESKKQYETIRSLVNLGVDLDALAAADKEDYEERTYANRQAKELNAQLAGMNADVEKYAGQQPVDVSEAAQRLMNMKAHREKIITAIQNCDERRIKIADLKAQISQLEKEHAAAQDELGALELSAPTGDEIAALETTIASASAINAGIEQARIFAGRKAAADEWQRKSDALTAAMESRAAQRQVAFESAEMPLPGLTLADGAVIYNGIPFDQASTAEQIRVSVAIAMATNPKLRVIRISDGSLLDDSSMKIIREMAQNNDFQVWVERVSDNDPMAVIIEDGEVVNAGGASKTENGQGGTEAAA